uniref:Uncharacterized protein n=1 Tax=Solanum lycopersicum TaxID=4081 RepID=A0A3Q7J9R9_SOLLC
VKSIEVPKLITETRGGKLLKGIMLYLSNWLIPSFKYLKNPSNLIFTLFNKENKIVKHHYFYSYSNNTNKKKLV